MSTTGKLNPSFKEGNNLSGGHFPDIVVRTAPYRFLMAASLPSSGASVLFRLQTHLAGAPSQFPLRNSGRVPQVSSVPSKQSFGLNAGDAPGKVMAARRGATTQEARAIRSKEQAVGSHRRSVGGMASEVKLQSAVKVSTAAPNSFLLNNKKTRYEIRGKERGRSHASTQSFNSKNGWCSLRESPLQVEETQVETLSPAPPAQSFNLSRLAAHQTHKTTPPFRKNRQPSPSFCHSMGARGGSAQETTGQRLCRKRLSLFHHFWAPTPLYKNE